MSQPSTLHMTVTRVLLGLVLLSAVGALILTGNSGVLRDNIGGQNLAKIGNKSITASDFGKIYARALEQNRLQDAMARQMGVPAMVLQREIDRQVLLQAANKMGVRVNNTYVAEQLKQQLEHITIAGTPQEKLKMILAQQKISEKELVELLRGDFAINLLSSAATTGGLSVPVPLITTAYRATKEQRIADIIPIGMENVKKETVSDKDAENYFAENKNAYRVPEKRDLAVLVLPQSLFVKDTTVSENDARAYFDEHQKQFLTPERVRLEQLIAPDEAAAKKIVDAKPASFENYKDDKIQYLKTDWYGRGTLPKDFVTALYPAKPTGMIGPIRTALGWHVLNVQSYDDAKPMSFDEAKAAVMGEMKDEKVDAQMTEFTNDLDAMIGEQASIESIADKYKLKIVNVTGLQTDNAEAQLKASNLPGAVQLRLKDAGFTLEENEMSPLLDTSDGDYVLVQVKKITPAAIPEFNAVKDRVTADAQKAHDAKALTALSEKLIGAYNAKNPAAFDQAVKEAGLGVQTSPAGIKNDMTTKYNKETAELVFTLTPDNPLSYTQGADKVTLVRLKKIISNNDTPDEKTTATLSDAVKNDIIQEMQQEFLQAWQQQVGINVNNDLLQSSFAPQAKEQ